MAMVDRARRKAVRAQQEHSRPEAGVYVIRNGQNGKVLLASSSNLAGVRNRLAWAQATNTPGALDHRLQEDIRRFGIAALSLEVLDVLEIRPEMTDAEIRADLATLEELWREKLDPALLY
jgi:hypothetical protein